MNTRVSKAINKMLVRLAKQNNTSPRIGALINVYQTTAIIYAPLTLIGVVTTLYGLWGSTIAKEHLPWFTVYHLVGFMVVFILIMMVFFYKVIIPSIVAFGMQQQYKHRNPLVTDIHEVLLKLDSNSDKLDSISTRLDKLERREKNQ